MVVICWCRFGSGICTDKSRRKPTRCFCYARLLYPGCANVWSSQRSRNAGRRLGKLMVGASNVAPTTSTKTVMSKGCAETSRSASSCWHRVRQCNETQRETQGHHSPYIITHNYQSGHTTDMTWIKERRLQTQKEATGNSSWPARHSMQCTCLYCEARAREHANSCK